MKKGKGRNNGLFPNSLRIISSCLKNVSTNASNVASSVRSAGASVAASISTAEDHKDQVTWAGFDRLELGPSIIKRVLLLGYQNGFQVFDVEDASNFRELVSKCDGPVSFLQMLPLPTKFDEKGFGKSHPLLLVVAGDDAKTTGSFQNCANSGGLARECKAEAPRGSFISSPTTVQFYSLRSHSYVHVLRFRSSVCMVRCSSHIIAVGLATQIYCFDALTLETKFSVLTYPIPQTSGQGTGGINVGYGPMAVGQRWLAYASKSPLSSNTGRLSPQNPICSPGVSPSTSPGGSTLVARYAMESSKQLAAGLINLSDMGYKTLSKYCQDLLPDGSSSPVSPGSSWKVGGLNGSEAENPGTVIVKDFVSGAVISQFKAHSSPISALCFDPSGTLLVTASVNGNSLNIFRIMPFYARNGSSGPSYDWRSSHVHIYKLHRGITSAIIQDICFSDYSQWIAIISSKGTCHVFMLSPFGGDAGFKTVGSNCGESSITPILSPPWWSTPSLSTDQQSVLPPPAVILSVVSRIKYSSFGWLNTVSNAATAATTGKVFVPSGAVAATFHNSVINALQNLNSRTNSLEHLLVYTPSGHVVQHELLPSISVEPSKNGARLPAASHVHVPEDDLRVKVEPIQWWDVCRRSDWPERQERVSETTSDSQSSCKQDSNNMSSCEEASGMDHLDISYNTDGQRSLKTCPAKPHEKSRLYLSNAEMRVSSERSPVWQNPKVSFHVMDSTRVNNHTTCGEFEIENIPTHEVEIKHKELLPVFDHFHCIKTAWGDRFSTLGKDSLGSQFESHQPCGKITQETIICHSKPASLSSTGSSEGGSSRRMEHLLDLDHISTEKSSSPAHPLANNINELYMFNQLTVPIPPSFEETRIIDTQVENHCTDVPAAPSLVKAVSGSSIPGNCNPNEEGEVSVSTIQTPVDFTLALREEHCKALEQTELQKLNEAVNDDDQESSNSGSHCEKEKVQEDGRNEEMSLVGDIFGFTED